MLTGWHARQAELAEIELGRFPGRDRRQGDLCRTSNQIPRRQDQTAPQRFASAKRISGKQPEQLQCLQWAKDKQPDATLIRSIAKAHQYYDAIRRGASFEEIAASEKLSKRRILQVVDLAFLAPDIVRSVLRGDQPIGFTAKWVGQNPLRPDWVAQRRIIATR
jgi:hypothetical protein